MGVWGAWGGEARGGEGRRGEGRGKLSSVMDITLINQGLQTDVTRGRVGGQGGEERRKEG